MRPSRPLISAILSFCLIAFQTQTLASATLPCQHESEMAAGCPMHAAAWQADAGQARTDADGEVKRAPHCFKCTLVLGLGPLHVSPSTELICSTPSLADHTATATDHYYRFFPERPIRPPQHRLL